MPLPTPVSTPFRGSVTVLVREGEVVSAGQVVAVVETMKMEAPLTTPRSGRVAGVRATTEHSLPGGEVVLVIE